ncbi:MAG: methyltransferase domain-containing protein [Alphaproteobacteria bacterium]|nr:methyltransferase domain-containing protein [Alphaproteobacteria bacterium]
MTSNPARAPLFDEARLRRHRALSQSFPNPTGFVLQKRLEEDLVHTVETLGLNASSLRRILVWGARLDGLPQALTRLFPKAEIIIADTVPLFLNETLVSSHLYASENQITLDSGSVDLALSCLSLQTLNDPMSALQNYHRLLAAGGVFIASFLGGQSLQHLHHTLLGLELSLNAGAHQRVIPMIDLSTALSLLQHAGFTECVTDHNALSFSFTSLDDFRHFLKTLGLQAPLREMPPTSKPLYHLLKATSGLAERVVLDVISMIGWKEKAGYPSLDVTLLP